MRRHKIAYTINGKEHYKVISYASTTSEAEKMILLSEKWNCPSCDVKVLWVYHMPTDLEDKNKTVGGYLPYEEL